MKLSHLAGHLTGIKDIPLEPRTLAERILSLGAELPLILQKDLKALQNIAVFSASCKRAIVEACKKVGRALPIFYSKNETVEDEEMEEEIVAQDMLDKEHNDDFDEAD